MQVRKPCSEEQENSRCSVDLLEQLAMQIPKFIVSAIWTIGGLGAG